MSPPGVVGVVTASARLGKRRTPLMIAVGGQLTRLGRAGVAG